MKRNIKKLLSYYKPYRVLFFSDMFFAMLGATITLIIPLIVRYITNEVVYYDGQQALKTIFILGAIMIARVFLKNPPILIFDEATSALDNESERVVQQSMEALAKNRTTFVIAHRLTTIRNAERILVLTENGIEEEGTHEELLEKNGAYSSLYQLSIQ